MNNSLPFDFGSLEIHQQTKRYAGRFQIVEALRGMLAGETLHAFKFDYQHTLDEQVGNVLADGVAFVSYGQRSLSYGGNAAEGEILQ
jgi:hypothetical protein